MVSWEAGWEALQFPGKMTSQILLTTRERNKREPGEAVSIYTYYIQYNVSQY